MLFGPLASCFWFYFVYLLLFIFSSFFFIFFFFYFFFFFFFFFFHFFLFLSPSLPWLFSPLFLDFSLARLGKQESQNKQARTVYAKQATQNDGRVFFFFFFFFF